MTTNIPQKLRQYMEMPNIADNLSEEELNHIGYEVLKTTQLDEESRHEWLLQYTEAMKIAKQVIEAKNTPWPDAANVKYPLLLTACIQFNARTNPQVIQGNKVVHIDVIRNDPAGIEEERADRLSKHMSYQLLGQSDNWRSDTDKLLMMLPLNGLVYRKSNYDAIAQHPQVDLCLPEDIVINNNVASVETARRITHKLELTKNQLVERMRAGLYCEYPLEVLESVDTDTSNYNHSEASEDEDIREREYYTVYEQHCYLDLDGDDYEEPYVVTVHKGSQRVLRIVARYDENSFIFQNDNSRWIKINPIHYFTDYHFLPSPDGSFHSLGFSRTLYPINETINTILNQLLDAGTLANRQGGFISGDAARFIKGELKFKPGEWKEVKTKPGQSLRDIMVPLPIAEPSPTLFSLLSLMIKTGQEIASVNDILQGQAPGANTPATTIMAMVEQGVKVYSSMLSRLYQSLKKEFEKLFNINKKYLAEEESFKLGSMEGMIRPEDYKENTYGIYPVANPSVASDMQKAARAQALMQLIEAPGVNVHEVLIKFLEALNVPTNEIKKVLPPPPPNPPPTPQDLLAQAELANVQAKTQLLNMQTNDIIMKRDLEALNLHIKERDQQAQAAYQGGQVTTDKINAISNLAKTDAMVGQSELQKAEKQADLIERGVHYQPVANDIQLRLNRIEQLLSSFLPQQQPQQQPSPEQTQPTQQTPQAPSVAAALQPEALMGMQNQTPKPDQQEGGQ